MSFRLLMAAPFRACIRSAHPLAPAVLTLALALPCWSQSRTLTASDYARAERLLGYNLNRLVLHAPARPVWLPDDRFWYRVTTEKGNEIVLVDPARGTRGPCEAQQEVKCTPLPRADANSVLSPDRNRAAFIRDFNLWVRETASGKETQLTKDGVKDFGYATDNAGWIRSDRPVVLWSPDSKKIATFLHDARGVGEMYLVHTAVGHPTLEAWKYPLAGDDKIFQISRVIIDVENARVIRIDMPPDPHRSSLCDHVQCDGTFADVQWSADSTQLAFVSSSRDHKRATLRVADAATGKVRDLIDEKVETYFEGGNDRPNWRFLPASNEVIWFSERDNWGDLYLYDLGTGKLKNRITSGPGNVSQTLKVDEKSRIVYFLGAGKESGRDPYFVHLYRAGLDGKNLTLLTPEDATHDVSMSPSGRYFVDSYSRPDVPPTVVLRDSEGKLLNTLDKADVSRLVANGWKPVTPITVKARDGATDLYGLLYKPSDFDFQLRPGSAPVDAGVRLPGINDDFTGRAPDLGAYEVGKAVPHYGPRP